MPKARAPYPLKFRQQMVELVRTGRTAARIEGDRWIVSIREIRGGVAGPPGSACPGSWVRPLCRPRALPRRRPRSRCRGSRLQRRLSGVERTNWRGAANFGL